MTTAKRTGILGGTFDPVHVGHLDLALAAQRTLELDEVLFMPSRVPPHRTDGPHVSVYHRFAMLALAVAPYETIGLSDLELRSPGVSYTSVTLEQLGLAGHRPSSLFFILGADAFAEIATWHDYPAVLERCHFVVVSRPGSPVSRLPLELPALAGRMRHIGSATDIGRPSHGPALSIVLVDTATRDVSSTEVRRRLASGGETDDLVPPSVRSYIARNRLYGGRQAGQPLAWGTT